ncbi:SIP domain-containing protein [Psychrobacter arenosus]|uniref:SIP domain-containing protein n=1 Tax=Psychrobacter arenosus TaxID=256326 RepID=UPI001918652A|nr:SIP domain-containing protein [Psychrobacter arenosus]
MNDTTLATNTDHSYDSYTAIDSPELTDIIAHINEEHFDELVGFLRAFTALPSELATNLEDMEVQLTTVYAEGICLQVSEKPLVQGSEGLEEWADKTPQPQKFFIAFAAPITQVDDLQTQYIVLKQRADKKLGKKTIKLTQQKFVVQDRYKVSKNMLRLQLSLAVPPNTANGASTTSDAVLPVTEAGYAYLFDLDHNVITGNNHHSQDKGQNDNSAQNSYPARQHRYYTLRKAWQTSQGWHAWVDVFLHGDTSGGNWAMALQIGDTVMTKREFPEKVAHLQEGQALLIVDETSMPTAARLLELWQNPQPPLVICVMQDSADQSYFDNIQLGSASYDSDNSLNKRIDNPVAQPFTVLPIVTDQTVSGQEAAQLIDTTLNQYLATQPLSIDKVWGALEATTAKTLRGLLKDRLQLSRTEVVVKVYWRHD